MIGTYETGFWFLDDEKTVHRTKPQVGFLWKLNTIEPHHALHPNTGPGFYHSSLIVESEEEVQDCPRCPTCFPQEQS